MSNNNRNRNQQQRGGGGGGGDNKVAISGGVEGKRNDCKIVVILRRGRQGLPNEQVMFRFGSPDRPLGPWLMDPSNSANRYSLTTNGEGERESIAFDLSGKDYEVYSQLMVVYRRNIDPAQGIYEQVFQLPVAEEATAAKGPVKKTKRLQFQAPEEPLKSPENFYHLPLLRSLNKDGKPSAEEFVFTSTAPVTLIDRSSEKPLENGGKKAHKTKYFVYKTPGTGLVFIDCQLEGALDCTLQIVHLESGETAVVKLEFEY